MVPGRRVPRQVLVAPISGAGGLFPQRKTDRLVNGYAPGLLQCIVVFAAPDNPCLGRVHFVRTVFHVAGRQKLLLSERLLQNKNTATEFKTRV